MTAKISIDSENASTEQSIPERFEKIAKRHPNRLAVKHRDQALSYESLNAAANRVAYGLLHTNGSNISAAALLFEQGIDVISAILGTLKTGARYCALDAQAPEERIEYILNDFQTDLILTNSLNFDLALRVARRSRTVINIDEIAFENSSGNPGVVIAPDQIAAVVYTSGSTGYPRGVIRTHQRTTTNVASYGVFRQLCGDDRISLTHSVSYSSGDADLLMGILNGAAIFPFSIRSEGIPNLAEWLKKERITIFHTAPSVFRELTGLAFPVDHFSDLRLIRLSGAPITQRDFDLYRSKFPARTRLEVGMGSTEAAAICNAVVDQNFSFPKEGSPVGYAREGKKIFILDEKGQVLPAGAIGEIAVKSQDFSLGYWRQPDLTERKYLRDSNGGDEITYLTRDLGTMLSDGFVIHLGRKDLTVKIRGYRVDISEVENALLDHPAVKEAGIAAWEREPGEKYLAAYVVADRDSAPTVSDLREFLSKKLPGYMIPSVFMFLDSLPLTNGKLDRLALPKPDNKRPVLKAPYVSPRTDIEKRLSRIWSEILRIEQVGIHDDFFDLGGHSLSGARLVSLIHEAFHFELPVSEFFAAPTIAQLSERIDGAAKEQQPGPGKKAWTYLCELQRGKDRKPVFIFPGGGGGEPEFFVYGFLARYVGTEYPFYGLRVRGADGKLKPHTSVEHMADAYVEEIRAIQPDGPYFLVGECAGGVNAYETARQLLAQGQQVAVLVLMDVERPRLTKYIRFRAGWWLDIESWPEAIRRRWYENYYIGRIPYHLDRLRSLPLRKYPRYLLGRIPSALKVTQKRPNSFDSRHDRADVVLRAETSGKKLRHIEWVRENYRRTVRRFRPEPYDGHIELLVSEKLYGRDPTLGWKKLALKGLNVHPLPGDHEMYIREHVAVAGLKLRECLERAEKRVPLSGV